MTFLVIEDGEEKGKIEEARLNKKINNLILLQFQASRLLTDFPSAVDECVVPLWRQPIYETTISKKLFDRSVITDLRWYLRRELAEIINSNKIGIIFNIEK